MAVDQLLQTGVGGAAFDLNGGQSLERIGGQSGDHGFAKALVQSRDRALRDQAHHGKSHLHAVGPRLGSNQRGAPMATAPPGADFVHTGTRALATADHQEHLLERGISALAHPASPELLHRHQQGSGVGNDETIWEAFHHDAAGSCVVGMDESIHKRFAQSFVGWGVVLAHAGIELEWGGQTRRQLGRDPLIELEEVRLPGAIGIDAIRPAQGGIELLAVIRKKFRSSRGIANGFGAAKHEEPCQGDPLLTTGAIPPPTLEFFEKFTILQSQPGMLPLGSTEPLPILAQAGWVKVRESKPLQDALVGPRLCCIGKHPAHLGLGALKIPLMVAAPSVTDRLGVQIHRTLRAICTPNLERQQDRLAHWQHTKIFVAQKIQAHLAAIIQRGPEIATMSLGLFS